MPAGEGLLPASRRSGDPCVEADRKTSDPVWPVAVKVESKTVRVVVLNPLSRDVVRRSCFSASEDEWEVALDAGE